jgi:hypothetical protein
VVRGIWTLRRARLNGTCIRYVVTDSGCLEAVRCGCVLWQAQFYFLFILFFLIVSATCPCQRKFNRRVVGASSGRRNFYLFFNFERERTPPRPVLLRENFIIASSGRRNLFLYIFLILSSSGPPPRPVPVRENLIGASSGRRNFFSF